jgi:Bax protein
MNKTIFLTVTYLLILSSQLTGGCRDTSIEAPPDILSNPVSSPEKLTPESYDDLRKFLRSYNYNLSNVSLGVPKFILTKLPEDMEKIAQPNLKKQLFFLSLLPMALMINEDIYAQRIRLLEILARLDEGESLSDRDASELQDLASSYRVRSNPATNAGAREELLKRIDIVPPSLLLAQAANESAYGTSRFAQRANNLFGEWTFTPGTGLIPEDRPDGARYEVRRFPNIMESLKSYVKNLNTHWAYEGLRSDRRQLRLKGEHLTGLALADGLELYSERRLEYVAEISDIIRYNRLGRLSDLSLRNGTRHQIYRSAKPTLLALEKDQ